MSDNSKSLMAGFKAQDLGSPMKPTPAELQEQQYHQQLVPGTSLTLAAAGRLENAAQHLVAVANLYAAQPPKYNIQLDAVEVLPAVFNEALSKITTILAGPGPAALDRRPQSVEIVGDPVLHEKAMLEAKAREMGTTVEKVRAMEMIAKEKGSEEAAMAAVNAAHAYDDQQAALRADILESYMDGKHEGRRTGFDDGMKTGRAYGLSELLTLSLWQLIKAWWAHRREPAQASGEVGGIDTSSSAYWRNHTELPLCDPNYQNLDRKRD